MEHARTTNKNTGTVYQWLDQEKYMIVDTVTAEPIRFSEQRDCIGTYREALDYIKELNAVRCIIVKLDSIVPHTVIKRQKT